MLTVAAGRRGRVGRPRRRPGHRLLEPFDAGQQGLRRVVGLGMGQPDQGHFEVDPGVGCVAHRDLGPSQDLHGPDQRGQSHPFGL